MKSNLFFLLLLAILICCCTRQRNGSQADRIATSNDIRVVLGALSDSVRVNGFAGWIPFLDNSTEFKWIYMGSTSSYDSLVARLRTVGPSANSYAMSWDSVHVEPVAENEATLFAICSEAVIDQGGRKVTMSLDINANLRKINGVWKFHSSEMSDHDPWRASPGTAVADTSEWFAQKIDSLIKASLGQNYHSGAILDVDDRTANAAYRVYQDMGYIFEDPNHQFQHAYIVALYGNDENGDTVLDSGSVAIIRNNRIAWRSKPLIRNMTYAPLPGFGDVNNDGTTDILITTRFDMRGYAERLWIISPDSTGGRLLNAVDERGESTIIGARGTFTFTQPTQTGAKVIKVNDLSTDLNRFFTYVWNGSVFVKVQSTKSPKDH